MTDARTVFFTGFPGFIARRLVAALAHREKETGFSLLCEPRFVHRATQAVQAIEKMVPGFAARAEIVSGDITVPDLGLPADVVTKLARSTMRLYHLAAIYDLAVPEEFARRINVVGTENVIALARKLERLERFEYFSTCYVAGNRTGRVFERDLISGQGWKNHYESTKYEAERRVQSAWNEIPTCVYRPSIVVGDSRTGETDKYDGPYFPLLLLMRLPKWVPSVYLGAGAAPANVVPVDFIVDATLAIGDKPSTLGKVHALADPNPLSARDLWRTMLERLDHPRPRLTVPMSAVRAVMQSHKIRQLLRMPMQVLDYFELPVEFDCTNTGAALEGTGIRCPRFDSYMDTIIQFARNNPQLVPLRAQIL